MMIGMIYDMIDYLLSNIILYFLLLLQRVYFWSEWFGW